MQAVEAAHDKDPCLAHHSGGAATAPLLEPWPPTEGGLPELRDAIPVQRQGLEIEDLGGVAATGAVVAASHEELVVVHHHCGEASTRRRHARTRGPRHRLQVEDLGARLIVAAQDEEAVRIEPHQRTTRPWEGHLRTRRRCHSGEVEHLGAVQILYAVIAAHHENSVILQLYRRAAPTPSCEGRPRRKLHGQESEELGAAVRIPAVEAAHRQEAHLLPRVLLLLLFLLCLLGPAGFGLGVEPFDVFSPRLRLVAALLAAGGVLLGFLLRRLPRRGHLRLQARPKSQGSRPAPGSAEGNAPT
mmetsp:Transcript_66362/g.142012  ORF Transcript_66362/g.142012 Transcript_66362/m.142012 type:complete len:301 (+) Transcript_66362:244-1146(+)